ncbi:MAG: hypothetical protein AAB360_00460 [Patescibacteria group bacterium]
MVRGKRSSDSGHLTLWPPIKERRETTEDDRLELAEDAWRQATRQANEPMHQTGRLKLQTTLQTACEILFDRIASLEIRHGEDRETIAVLRSRLADAEVAIAGHERGATVLATESFVFRRLAAASPARSGRNRNRPMVGEIPHDSGDPEDGLADSVTGEAINCPPCGAG